MGTICAIALICDSTLSQNTQRYLESLHKEFSEVQTKHREAGVALKATLAKELSVAVQQHREQLKAEETKLDAQLSLLGKEQETKRATMRKAEERRIAEDDRRFEDLVKDEELWSGKRARDRREQEWKLRKARDPEVAASAFEATILKMQSIGSNLSLDPKVALKEVAMLASPPNSRVEVRDGAQGFLIRVAFSLSSLDKSERGAVTAHNSASSLRRAMRDRSAEVMRDLYEHCGNLGISKVSVSCNHAVRQSYIPRVATSEERVILERESALVMDCLFRGSIERSRTKSIGSWRDIPLTTVTGLMKIEKDTVEDVKIGPAAQKNYRFLSGGDESDKEDPKTPLRFD